MIIDCHNHPDWHGHNLERFLENMARYNIDKTWLLSWECPRDEYSPWYNPVVYPEGGYGPVPFSRCLSYAERAPGKFVLGYAPDPRRPDAIDALRAGVEIHRAKICGEHKVRMMLDNPDAVRMFRFCGEEGLPVSIHIDYEFETGSAYPRPSWWYGGGIDALERTLKLCPDTIFLGHAPGFWAHISGDDKYNQEAYPKGPVLPGGKVVTLMRECSNLYCDLSGGSGHNALSRDLQFTKQFLLEFQDRSLYGRDYFDNQHQELLNSLGLPEDVLEKIYCRNALRLVPLDE